MIVEEQRVGQLAHVGKAALCPRLRRPGLLRLVGGRRGAPQEREDEEQAGRHGPSVPPHELAGPVAERVGTGADRQAVQVPPHVARELLDRLVAAGRLLAEGGQQDGVEVPPEAAPELLGATDGAGPLRIGRPDRLDHLQRRAAPEAVR